MATSDFTRALLEQLGAAGLIMARRAIGSAALREAIRFELLSDTEGRLLVPHYWALYHHDGRGPVFPVKKRFLVWFVDPKDDPRLRDGYPVRLRDVRRLTRAEFIEGLEENKRRRRQAPDAGDEQFMRVREVSGPTAPQKAYPFFTQGMEGFPSFATQLLRRSIARIFKELAVRERSTARIRF